MVGKAKSTSRRKVLESRPKASRHGGVKPPTKSDGKKKHSVLKINRIVSLLHDDSPLVDQIFEFPSQNYYSNIKNLNKQLNFVSEM